MKSRKKTKRRISKKAAKRIRKIASASAAFALCLALAFALVVQPLPAIKSEAAYADYLVRVYLSTYGNPSKIKLKAEGSYMIKSNAKSVSGSFIVGISSDKKLYIKSGDKTYKFASSAMVYTSKFNTENYIQVSGKNKFLGSMMFIKSGEGVKMINHVDMENYIKGVLPYEMSDSAPIEALKAQAIASRSFGYWATHSRDRSKSDFDVYNSTQSQVYYGYTPNAKNCAKAVEATAKMVLLTKKGDPVFSVYSASNGGKTEYPKSSRASDSNPTYLPGGKNDSYDATASLASSAYSASVVIPKSLEVPLLKKSDSQPYAMLRSKLKPLLKDKGRKLSEIKSAKVTAVNRTNAKFTKPSRAYTGAKITLSIKYNDNKSAKFTLVYPPYKKSGYIRPFLNNTLKLPDKLKFFMLYRKEREKDFVLASVRYGHGSGMSQIGAYQMAKKKKNYDYILEFYYNEGKYSFINEMDWKIPA